MFDILKTANVTITDFAKIAGVSRVSVSHWVNGKMKPHKLHSSKINLILAAMTKAVEAEELPLPQGLSREAALKRMKASITRYVMELRKAKTEE